MAKFEVTIYIEGNRTVEVEADNADAAQAIAKDKFYIDQCEYEISDIEVKKLDEDAKEDK